MLAAFIVCVVLTLLFSPVDFVGMGKNQGLRAWEAVKVFLGANLTVLSLSTILMFGLIVSPALLLVFVILIGLFSLLT